MSPIIAVAPGATQPLALALVGLLGGQGRVLQFFAPGAFILDVPPGLMNAVSQIPGITAVAQGAIPSIDALAPTPELKALLQGWNLQFDPAFAATRATRSLVWFPTPAPCSVAAASPAAQSHAMTGDVAVGIVVVDGPPGSIASFTDSERIQVLLAIPQGWGCKPKPPKIPSNLGLRVF